MITKTKRNVIKRTSNLELSAYFSYDSPQKAIATIISTFYKYSTNHKVNQLKSQIFGLPIYLDLETYTYQQIPLLLAESALSCQYRNNFLNDST